MAINPIGNFFQTWNTHNSCQRSSCGKKCNPNPTAWIQVTNSTNRAFLLIYLDELHFPISSSNLNKFTTICYCPFQCLFTTTVRYTPFFIRFW